MIPIKGWQHGQPYVLPVKPSPNLPDDTQSIRLYASLCPFEATRISVGRGTTFPFQVLGAPDKKYGDFVFTPRSLPGFDKNPMHKGSCLLRRRFAERNRCKRIHAPLPPAFLSFIRRRCSFLLRPRWFDLLMGTDSVRKAILQGKSEKEICDNWQKRVADLPGHEAEVFTLLRNGSATSPHSVRNLQLFFPLPTPKRLFGVFPVCLAHRHRRSD